MGALDGIKVIEAGLLIQGPQAAATMAEWGADVVKVELPGFGDQARWLPAREGDSRSAYFIAANRGKRSVTMDLRKPEGRDAFLRLAAGADVVITNFKPGTMEAWGLGYEQVAAHNPRVVYATGSTFGPEGDDAQREGADLSGQAVGGIISMTNGPGEAPTPIGATIADHIGSLNILSGVLAALLRREKTGRGQRVDTSLLGGQIWAQAAEMTGLFLTGEPCGPSARGHSMIPGLYGIFPTADGWLAVVGVAGGARKVFYEVIGRPELTEQYPQLLYWDEQKRAVFPIVEAVFRTKTTEEWCSILGAAGLRYAPVRTHRQVAADPGVWTNRYLLTVEGPEGPMTVPCVPVRFSETPGVPPALVPELGQNTEEVLLEAGYTWEEIAELQAAGAV